MKKVVWVHIVIWLALGVLRIYKEGCFCLNTETQKDLLIFLMPAAALFYFIAYFTAPMLIERRFIYFFLASASGVLIYSFSRTYLVSIIQLPEEVQGMRESYILIFFTNIWNGAILSIPAVGIFLTERYYLVENNRQKLQNKLKNSELAFLKAQMNPHFLHNSLNFLYSQAYEVSESLGKSILLLSEIMRYATEESDSKGKVKLSQELAHLNNFIEIHRLRYKTKLSVDFENLISTDYAEKIYILPLVLISILENTFKHGIVTKQNDPVSIKIIEENEYLHFSIRNPIDHQRMTNTSQGMGINAIKRMLELAYPEKHSLAIENDGLHFKLALRIKIDK